MTIGSDVAMENMWTHNVSMTPSQFIERWKTNTTSERSGAQSHFNDLCELLKVEKPNDSPHNIDRYCFERGAKRTGAGNGWADVWMRGRFAWEYKKPGKDLDAALKQLMSYALALDNPPLLIVSDRLTIHIHTHFTGHPSEVHTIAIDEIGTPENLQKLKWLFSNPEKFKPQRTTAAITLEAAALFGDLALTLQDRGHDPQQVAHFLNKILFCLFAEDAKAPGQESLLQEELFSKLLKNGLENPERGQRQIRSLFKAMGERYGEFGEHSIEWFNGGLFDDDIALPLTREDFQKLVNVSILDWSQIEPSIFGTLFERGLNPKKRSQRGAHYTDPNSIMRIVEPVIVRPLLKEWEERRFAISELMDTVHRFESSRKPTEKAKATRAYKEAYETYIRFLERLKKFRVLDPACGSGNFLYMALRGLKDIELKVNLDAEALGLERSMPQLGPECVYGIEIDPYAAELARVTVWIGEIQWMLQHGYSPSRDPILRSLNQIECKDALIETADNLAFKSEWPHVDVIVGNPPFLGDKKLRGELGDLYVDKLREVYDGDLPGGSDLVCYWFERAREVLVNNKAERAGFVSTNSIRGGANRAALDRLIDESLTIYNAWSDEPWVNDGADVRVSQICFGRSEGIEISLDGKIVPGINSDLTEGAGKGEVSNDVTKARTLTSNAKICFMGTTMVGAFDLTGEQARSMLRDPNPDGRLNSEVVRPWTNAMDITRRSSDTWVIDFGVNIPEESAMQYVSPWKHIVENVAPTRAKNKSSAGVKTWIHQRPRPEMRKALSGLKRYIVTPGVAKHRIFVFRDITVLPDHAVFAFARDDYTTFGILHSRIHEVWTLHTCTFLGVGNDPRYTPTSCFETFPFPVGLEPTLNAIEYASDHRSKAIADAAKKLDSLREAWLNPPDWTDRIAEVVPGFPDRILPKIGFKDELKKRTLTNLYNALNKGDADWLRSLHDELDISVANAYGWSDYSKSMSDREILNRLLKMNLSR